MPFFFSANRSGLTVQLQIEETSRRLRTGDLGIPPNPEERFDSIARTLILKA